MSALSFRVFFGGSPATVDDLRTIEEIKVEQSEDAAWEAHLVMSLCLDASGHWARQDDLQLAPRTQLRVELKIGTDDFKPLIEGPIVAIDNAMDARAGRSTTTIVVHDDSAWLNMASDAVPTEGQTDTAIASDLFTSGSSGHVTQTDVQTNPARTPASLGDQFAQLGTPMQKLRHLAARNGFRAFVLPGDTAGQSIGCFKGDPTDTPTLPPLVLLGPSRNLFTVTATEDPEVSRATTLHTLSLGDQQVQSYTTSASDETLLGAQTAAPAPSTRTLSPTANDTEDPAARAAAEIRRLNFPVKYTGQLIACAYSKILTPHQKIALQAGAASISTVILLTKVTHRITPSVYEVNFEGRGNSLAQLQAAAGLPTSIV